MLTIMLYDEKIKGIKEGISDAVAGVLMAYAVFYAALTASAQINDEPIDFDYAKVTEWVDELFVANPKAVNDVISDLMSMSKGVPEPKKKAITKAGKM